jgi:trk system potassium uptake protein TrkA
VARVNQPKNEWLFDDLWGVDVAVSTPRIMCALAEEAVSVGDLVRLFRFTRSDTGLVEMILPESSPCVGKSISEVEWPVDGVLLALIRDGRGRAPGADFVLEGADELLFLVPPDAEKPLARFLSPTADVRGGTRVATL